MNSNRWIVSLVLGACLGLAPGGPSEAEELWVPPTHFYPAGLNVFPWPTSGTGLASFGFAVPNDFRAFTSATVVLIPKANVTGNFDVYGSVKRDGEAAAPGLVFNVAVPATLTAGTVSEIDITGLLGTQLDPTSAGTDYVSVFFWFPTSPGLENATVLGLRFAYDPVRLATEDIENGAVTNAKLADNSVGTDKVVNNSLGSEDIQNGSIGAADVNLGEIQARIAESCPAGQSIRLVGPAGGVTCEVDTVGLTSYQRIRSDELCPANTACIRSVSCTGDRKAMGGGVEMDELFEFDRANQLDVFQSYPFSDVTWTVGVVNQFASDTEIDLYVICSAEAAGSGSTSAAEGASGPRADRPLSRR